MRVALTQKTNVGIQASEGRNNARPGVPREHILASVSDISSDGAITWNRSPFIYLSDKEREYAESIESVKGRFGQFRGDVDQSTHGMVFHSR